MNESACASLGYTRLELLERTIFDVDDTWTRERLLDIGVQLERSRALTIEGLHERKDGTLFPVEARAGLIDTGDRKLILALVRDITERKRIEARHRSMMDELDTG